MGMINEIRLININYNNGGIRINDETLHMNGISTLISLQNGGGKSVLVQMITAPFVHKAYRRTKDRSFEGYFTGSKPSFILIEWTLGGGHKMMNGFMVRRRPEETGENGEEGDVLDIIGIISEYREACQWDIHNLQVVEKSRRQMTLKSFAFCKQLFEDYKKDRSAVFYAYDMNQSAQQRQYFEKLKDYKVDYREWENIIKKVNQKEGGLADLFSDCRDERDLTKKWLLDAVEKKLDPDGRKIQNFGKIIKHHSVQCYENEDKIKRRDDILLFREKIAPEKETPECPGVKGLADKLWETDSEILDQENRIICFREEIRGLSEETGAGLEKKRLEIEENISKEERLRYEKYSREILLLIKEKEELERNMLLTSLEIEGLNNERDAAEESLRLLETRRVYDEKQEELRIREKLYSDLLVTKKTDSELKPRREELGGILRGLYEEKTASGKAQLEDSEKKIRELKEEEKKRNLSLSEIDEDTGKLQMESGRLQAAVESFNREEDAYQKTYRTSFTRNILGEYEDGALSIEEDSLSVEKKENDDKRKAAKERKQREEIKEKKLESDLSDQRIRRNDLIHDLDSLKNEKEEMERQKRERLEACAFVGLKEEQLYDREEILRAFDGKIEQSDGNIHRFQEMRDRKLKEKEALESGRIAEIPERIQNGFEKLSINLTYGMEWLLKNGRSIKNNQQLVRNNPFLPYSLILTDKELDRVKKADERFYTEMPVPIVLRQELDKDVIRPECYENAVAEIENIRFYVNFNENLLDPEKLNKMIGECRSEIMETEERIRIRKDEREEYVRRRETVRTETLTKELEERILSGIVNTEENIKETEDAISGLEAEREETRAGIAETVKEIEAAEKKAFETDEQLRRLRELIKSYEKYLSCLEKKHRIEKELGRLSDRKKMTLEILDKLREDTERQNREQDYIKRIIDESEKRLTVFAGYRIPGNKGQSFGKEEITAMEAEYDAITEKFSGEVRQLEKDLAEQEKRCRRAGDKLDKLFKKYDIGEKDIENVAYSEAEAEQQQENAAAAALRIAEKEARYHEEDKEISVKKAHISDLKRRMTEETGNEAILPAEEIPEKDYDGEIALIRNNRKKLEKEEKELDSRYKTYRELVNSLDEYEGTPRKEGVSFEEDFSSMTGEKLLEFRGILRRDLMRYKDERQKRRNRLADSLNDIILMPKFREDFYRKPLEAMLRLVDSPDEVLRHIDITLRSYDDLMEKIAVDLSVIEDERKSIHSELLDYIRDVNGELDKIDANSTIPVKDRTIKMLTISLPGYAENEEIYRIRLRDYLESLVNKGMALCRDNQNMDDYIGTRLNTREIFETVIGTSNVQIRLYKIEKMREYPISWADVSKNSGGEGFLSSFVILSSLLTYIRRDENDLFADRNEGKVLLMDNPFGVTYSEHLLKPLMELAEKNNTQLICLSGIGGDSIYGRFDNIYVMNLVAAGLKNGMQYLRSDHIRGSEPEEIVSSQVEVLEQMTLF